MKSKSFIPAYLYSLFLWIVASLPGNDLQKIQKFPEDPWLRFFLSDPFMHFLTFGLLALIICRGYDKGSGRSIPLVRVGLLAFVYGFMIELYQSVLPWRSFGLDDLIWNTVGILFFLGLVRGSLSLKVIARRVKDRVRKC